MYNEKIVNIELFEKLSIYPKVFESIEKRYSDSEIYKYNNIKMDILPEIIDGKIPNYKLDFIELDIVDRNKHLEANDYCGYEHFYFEIFHFRNSQLDLTLSYESPDYGVKFHEENLDLNDPCIQDPLIYTSRWYSFTDVLEYISLLIKEGNFSVYDYDYSLNLYDGILSLELKNKS